LLRLCLDLNIWCAAFIGERLGRRDTAAGSLVEAVRTGRSAIGQPALVISWGMLERLEAVLVRDLAFGPADASRFMDLIASYAREGPSLTLGGVGVIPIRDTEDRHVMETAWAGQANLLVTQNLPDFTGVDATPLSGDRVFGLRRGDASMVLAHPYEAAAWLRGGEAPKTVQTFLGLERP
jgi:hypothetical protein